MAKSFLTDIDMLSTQRIRNLPDAVTFTEPATFGQLNAAIDGRKYKNPALVASTANLTLSGTQTIDGVAVSVGDYVLVKDQSTGSQNGVYVVQSGAWTRRSDFDAASEISGASLFIQKGTANHDLQFTCSTDDPITIGTTALVFIQTSAGGAYTSGTGISIVGLVINIDIAVVARKVGANIGNASATSFNVVHNLGTTDAAVLVREIAGGLAEVECDVVFTDSNTVTVTFATAPTTNQYRVTVIG